MGLVDYELQITLQLRISRNTEGYLHQFT